MVSDCRRSTVADDIYPLAIASSGKNNLGSPLKRGEIQWFHRLTERSNIVPSEARHVGAIEFSISVTWIFDHLNPQKMTLDYSHLSRKAMTRHPKSHPNELLLYPFPWIKADIFRLPKDTIKLCRHIST
jgi:hypothetical protein